MNVSEIIYKVKAAIDELSTLDYPKLAESVNLENIDLIIVDKIPYALEWIIQNAPATLLTGDLTESFNNSGLVTKVSDDYVFEIELPSTTLRVVSARLSTWMFTPEMSDEHSDVAAMQMYPTSRGTWDNPACVIYNENGKQILRMFSGKTRDDVYYITLALKPDVSFTDTWDGEAVVPIPERLTASFIYYIAGLTTLAMKEDVSKSLLELAVSSMATK
jgi:hypothetical protein